MEAKLSRTWQDSYERWKAPVAIGVVVVAFVLGLVGWRLTDETLGVGDVLYNTLAMFALNFGHDGPIHWVLDVARFLAAVVVYWAAFAVAIKVISRGSPVRRAAKLKRHVVLMGDTDEVAPIAGRYRDAGRDVVVVGALASQDVEFLRRRHVVVVPLESENDLSSRDLRRIISSAERVVVVGDDESAPRLAARVRDGSAVTPPTTLLVDTGEFAAFWAHEHGDVTLCRSTQAAIALLRVHPPFLETAMVPPPVVLGDSAGTMAAEIVRRIVTGWQQPGERVTVHCLASDAEWVERVRVGLGGRADLRLEVVAPLASSAGRAVADIVAAWPRPDAAKFSVAGPRVYVAYADVSVSVLVASAIAEAVPDANVIGVVDNATCRGWTVRRPPSGSCPGWPCSANPTRSSSTPDACSPASSSRTPAVGPAMCPAPWAGWPAENPASPRWTSSQSRCAEPLWRWPRRPRTSSLRVAFGWRRERGRPSRCSCWRPTR